MAPATDHDSRQARHNGGRDDRYYRAEVHLAEGSQRYDVMGHTSQRRDAP